MTFQPRTFAAVSFAIAFLLYANTIPNRYSMDDETVTRGHHETSRGLAALPEIFTTSHIDFAGQEFDYRPVTLASFALEHDLFGENPHVGHFVNVLLYALTAVLLFRYLLALFGAGSAPFAFTATVIFAVHPIHTEVVASLKNREEILALLFALGSALLFLRYVEHRRAQDAVLGFVAFFVALMCKLSALPFVVLVPVSVALRDRAKLRTAALLGVALVACLLAYQAVVLSFVPALTPVPAYVENPLVIETSWSVRAGTASSSLLFYLEKLLVPYPLHFYYGFDTIPVVGVFSPRALLSVVLYAGLVLFAVRSARTAAAAAFGVAWYLVSIAPYANVGVLAKGIVAERSAYVASIGVAIVVAHVLFRSARLDVPSGVIRGKQRQGAIAAAAILLGTYALLTFMRNRAWADSFTLYATDLPRLERSVMAHQIYARQLRREFGRTPPSPERTRQLTHAIDLSERALGIAPAYAEAHEHIGAIQLYDLDRPVDAWTQLARASDLEPGYTQAHYDALYCSVLLNRFEDALRFGERLLRADPDHVMGLFYLSKVHFRAGDVEKAFAENARLAAVAPERDLAYVNYGYFYYERGDAPRAIANFERAIAIAPNNPPVLRDLVAILEERGEKEKAARYAAMAEQLGAAARVNAP